jgi:hypothetical protein
MQEGNIDIEELQEEEEQEAEEGGKEEWMARMAMGEEEEWLEERWYETSFRTGWVKFTAVSAPGLEHAIRGSIMFHLRGLRPQRRAHPHRLMPP